MNEEEGMRITQDLKVIQSELELTRVHVIELEKIVLLYTGTEGNDLIHRKLYTGEERVE